jgi:NhaA family Na+:H+ antiporter
VVALHGKRVPFGFKIVLLSLAIAVDNGAVLGIPVFNPAGLSLAMLGAAGPGVAAGPNRLGVRSVGVYAAVAALVWLAVLRPGIHPTTAGVALGLSTLRPPGC